MDKPMALRNEDLEKNKSLTYPKWRIWIENAAWMLIFLVLFHMCIVLITDY